MTGRLPRWAGALFFIGTLLVLAGAVFLIVRDIGDRRRSDALERALSALDERPATNMSDRVSELLHQAANAAETQQQWLSVLSRAVTIAEESNNWEPARTYALQGARELPGSQALWAVAAYATMRSGENAAWIAREHLTADRYQTIRSEALLRATDSGQDSNSRSASVGDSDSTSGTDSAPGRLTGLNRSSDPEEFRQAYELTGDRRFLLDAALRHAEEGALEEALQSLVDAAAYEAALYVAYDLGQLERTQSLLERLSPRQATSRNISLLRADILSRLGNRAEAARVYRELLHSEAAAPVAYQNLLWLSEIAQRNVPSGLPPPREMALRGSGASPSHTILARISTILLAEENPERARTFSEERLQSVDEPGKLALLRHHLFRRKRPLSARFADLWQLWNKYRELSIARYIGWLAVSVGNTEELRLIVRSAGRNRIPLYGGIYAMETGTEQEALKLFRMAADSEAPWEAAANVAALLNDQGNAEAAIEVADQQLSRLSEESPASVLRHRRARAVLLYEKARGLAQRDQLEQAFTTVEEALSTEQELSAARLLRRRLADRIDR